MSDQTDVTQVKEQYKETVLDKPNVVGLGTGYKVRRQQTTGELSVVVLVRQKVPREGLAPEELVPSQLEGVSTDVVQVGEIRAQQDRTDRWRPARGGVSLGHFKVTAGTFGTVVRDRATGAHLILSNNHVLANSNAANPRDPILQPGAVDGGRQETDTIARLERFCPIEFNVAPPTCGTAIGLVNLANTVGRLLGTRHRFETFQVDPQATNLADAAVARPLNENEIMDEILEIGEVSGTVPAALGMSVRKSGRTTGLTTGRITVLDATVSVSYGTNRTARFEGQIVTGAMSQGGDSGSLLVAGDSLRAVGLLFAGSEQSTIFNPIQAVLDCLEVTI